MAGGTRGIEYLVEEQRGRVRIGLEERGGGDQEGRIPQPLAHLWPAVNPETFVAHHVRPRAIVHVDEQAIRAIGGGGSYLDPAVAGRVIGDYGRRRQAVPTVAGAGTLSSREEEVLRLIAWGYSNKEIAARLDLSVKTVETHKANAMHKLQMRSRIDIVRFALLQGWLEDK